MGGQKSLGQKSLGGQNSCLLIKTHIVSILAKKFGGAVPPLLYTALLGLQKKLWGPKVAMRAVFRPFLADFAKNARKTALIATLGPHHFFLKA